MEAQYYRAKAQLARENAEYEESPDTKTVWKGIADDYDLTAESLEHQRQQDERALRRRHLRMKVLRRRQMIRRGGLSC